MTLPRSRFGSAATLAFALFLVFAIAFASGCHRRDDDGDGDTPGDGGGTTPPTTVAVHAFEYEPDTGNYLVLGDTISGDDVERDLAGSLCSKCHPGAVPEVKDSVHFKLAAKTDRVLFPGGGAHGMLDRACGLPSTTGLTNSHSDINLGECAKCHVGRYLPVMEGFFASMFGQMGVADPQGQATQLINAGIDCLVCHADVYRSVPKDGILAAIAPTAPADGASPTAVGSARASRDNGDFNRDGAPDLVIDVDGDGVMDAPLMYDTDGDGQPDTPWPTVAQDRSMEAIASISETTDHSCLRCHEHARTGYKRGTLFAEGHDVHSTASTGPFAGADNQCTVCHEASGHKFVRGHMVGGDLGAADFPPPPPGTAPDPNDPTDLTCQKCHDEASLPATIHTSSHLAAIACETCHIPYGSGITYSLFGEGGHVAFGRNSEGKDTLVITADMQMAGDKADIDADFEAFKTQPILVWFNGGTSFLAQTLAARGMPNAKITPFKPMANGMVFDSRFFSGETVKNDLGVDYNAYSMYRFFANGNNAEAFYALGMLDMLPEDVRKVTLADFQNPDPDVQTMALMLVFPNLVYFDKANFGFEHFLTKTGSPYDTNNDGVIDSGSDFHFSMFDAANAGLMQFAGFNGPMGFPVDYQWYPPFTSVKDVISMKLPDGSFMKMFMEMQAAQLPADQQAPFLASIADYPAYSQVTLGGHGVVPKEQALGNSCMDCHGSTGALAAPTPVTRKTRIDMGPMGVLDLPTYQWKYYNVKKLIDLGLATQSEEIVAGTKDVDIDGDATYVRASSTSFTINMFAANDPAGYRPADDATALAGTNLQAADLSWNGGDWMPVLEPVVDYKPNYEVLGYQKGELIWN